MPYMVYQHLDKFYKIIILVDINICMISRGRSEGIFFFSIQHYLKFAEDKVPGQVLEEKEPLKHVHACLCATCSWWDDLMYNKNC